MRTEIGNKGSDVVQALKQTSVTDRTTLSESGVFLHNGDGNDIKVRGLTYRKYADVVDNVITPAGVSVSPTGEYYFYVMS